MAESAASIISRLNLGTAKSTIKAALGSPLNTLIIGVHQEIIDRLSAKLLEYDAVASNRLKQSLISIDASTPGKIDVGLSADFYWKYVNYGVNGIAVSHGAPTWGPAPSGSVTFKDAILLWMKDRGIQALPGQTYDQAAFNIMRSVRMNGIAPRPFFTDVVNKQLGIALSKSISTVMGKAITVSIKNPKFK